MSSRCIDKAACSLGLPVVLPLVLPAVLLLLALTGCGGGRGDSAAPRAAPSAGQVAPAAPAARMSYYAAARFAEQATFGPTPALIAELQAKGFERWLDEQFALPATQTDTAPALVTGNPIPIEPYEYQKNEYQRLILSSPDQLRARMVWSLSQFITVSGRTGHPVALIDWSNMLQRQAFGTYAELLYQVSVHPMMAQYLNNDQNRPKSNECQDCAPNENFARELMQLFTLGVFKLNADGSPVRDSQGRYVETYTQTDVEQLARMLTGWEHVYDPFNNAPIPQLINYSLKTMIPTTWPPARDAGAKVVLGRNFAAGQSQEKDLRDAINMLMDHPNSAPFVSLRLIQHFVKSNPSPAYLSRVAGRFRNNGNGVVGDMKSVLKAILLDPEARAGDDPTRARADDGKVREPALQRSAILRVLGCQRGPFGKPASGQGGGSYWLAAQPHLYADSVFSFYAPSDRAPGSNLLSPEQKLLTGSELTERMGHLNSMRYNPTTQTNDRSAYTAAGCQLDPLVQAFNASPRAFNDLMSSAFFRGAMPPPLRLSVEQAMARKNWDASSPDDGALRVLGFALASPYFGAMK